MFQPCDKSVDASGLTSSGRNECGTQSSRSHAFIFGLVPFLGDTVFSRGQHRNMMPLNQFQVFGGLVREVLATSNRT